MPCCKWLAASWICCNFHGCSLWILVLILTFCCRCTLKFTSYKHEKYLNGTARQTIIIFLQLNPKHDLERDAPRILYRICNTVARQNSNALHLIVRGRKDESVGFIVLVVTEESQWEALSTFLKIDAQDLITRGSQPTTGLASGRSWIIGNYTQEYLCRASAIPSVRTIRMFRSCDNEACTSSWSTHSNSICWKRKVNGAIIDSIGGRERSRCLHGSRGCQTGGENVKRHNLKRPTRIDGTRRARCDFHAAQGTRYQTTRDWAPKTIR